MKAIIREKSGKEFSSMKLQELSPTAPKENELKIKMHASRINPVDMDLMKGMPFLKYKSPQIGGIDGAGEVIEVGSEESDFNVGDQVFFYRLFTDIGTWAETITIPSSYVAKIPKHWSLEQAGTAALPLLTAFDSIEQLNAKEGDEILVHGAGGGVGFMAVQIATALGMKVTANASERDKELLNRANVERIIDYKKEAFDQVMQKAPDHVFDVIGKDTLLRSIALQPKKVVSVAYVEPEKMSKTGIQMPGIVKKLIGFTMKKFKKAAYKNDVTLIGQVTGANGKMLDRAARLAEEANFIPPKVRGLSLTEIERKGLSKSDLGKTIQFLHS